MITLRLSSLHYDEALITSVASFNIVVATGADGIHETAICEQLRYLLRNGVVVEGVASSVMFQFCKIRCSLFAVH